MRLCILKPVSTKQCGVLEAFSKSSDRLHLLSIALMCPPFVG